MIDRAALLAFLRERLANMRNPLTMAIYAGLITRVESGDFDA